MLRPLRALRHDDGGATAAVVGLSLFALVAAGGIAFDYARLAGMHTELQGAADQAALAAAGQLDRRSGAITRARSAATALIANETRLANDGAGRAIGVPTVLFYSGYSDTSGPFGVTSVDTEARYVRVSVGARIATYALTPVVGALNSGAVGASALAGVGSAICNSPPVMICNPQEPAANTNVNYPFTANAGVGIRLTAGSPDTPGNFGFLETGFGSGANNLAKALGYNATPGSCRSALSITTKPGLNASVMNALNTRFDIFTNGASTCPAGGTCSPSINVRKDVVHRSNQCGTTGNGWQFVPALAYLPTSATVPLATSVTPRVMGHPRDMCHAVSVSGSCAGGRIGDGVWDRAAYFRANYPSMATTWPSVTGLSATATRYAVYLWENTHQSQLVARDGTPAFANPNQNLRTDSGPACGVAGITPGASVVDRRRMSVAVVNCRAAQINGSASNVPVTMNLDVFLVEPSFNRSDGGGVQRTTDNDIYVEVIGQTGTGTTGTGAQVVRRDVPRIIE